MENVGEQINSVINNLADKLGVAAEKLYPVLLKQAYIDGIFGIVLIICFVVTLIVSIRGLAKNLPNACESDDWSKENIMAVVHGLLLFISVIGTLVCIFKLREFYTALFNPDWYALQMILEKIKGN